MCQIFLEIIILHIPSYLFILAYVIRSFALKSHICQTPKLTKIHCQWPDDDTSPNRNRFMCLQKSISLLLKIAFSQILAFLYLVELLIGFFISEEIMLISCEKYFIFSFMIGFCSWWMSASLLRLEFEKELPQACYTHRIFWLFSFFFGILDLITTQENLLNFIFNIIKLFFIVVLCFYAVFKPVDIEIHGVSPLFGKCFKIFENNCIIILFVKFGAYQEDFFEEYNKDSPGISSVSKDSPCSSANKESPGILPRAHPSSFKINLVNLGSDNSPNNNVGNSSSPFQVPKNRAVTINRNVFIKKIVSDEILFYQVITQFEFKLYIADRNYQEFIQLQKDLSLNDSDSSKLLINITELPSPTFDQRKFIESLEKYLQTIIQNISSINYIVLNFLNVSPEDQIPFLKFQESMIKNKCSILMQPKKKRNLRISRQSSTTSKDEYLSKNTSPARIISIFDITCTKWWKMLEGENQLVMFEFQLINYNKKGVQVWNIQKQYSDIKNFHTELEKQIRKEINLFNGMVPRASNISLLSDEFLEKRRKGLEKYMQSILSNKHFYCNVLYEFLEFDPENDRPISLENEPENNNVSQYKGNDLKIDAFNFVVEQEDASEVLLLDLSRATPRHLKAIKHQQSQFNDSMSPYFRNDERRMISGINFNFVSVKLVWIKEVTFKQDFLSSGMKNLLSGKELHYYITLEEFVEKARGKFKTRTLIKMVKKYSDFKALNQILKVTYQEIDDNFWNLPPDVENKKFIAEEMKKKWDDYFFYLLKIPKIEQNESFRDFFNLNRLGPSFEFVRGDSEVFDFT